jgi:GNAT superfamily N-acetyltransferase
MTLEVRRIRADEGLRLRGLRLQALTDAPGAFGSTLAREAAFPDQVWHERAEGGASGVDRATFIAEERDRWVGLATGLAHDPDDADRGPILVGMFVDPAKRGRGIGVMLVEAVAAWARARADTRLYLWVTSTNDPAIALYAKCGFRRTGEIRPRPHSPSIVELLMVRDLRSAGG